MISTGDVLDFYGEPSDVAKIYAKANSRLTAVATSNPWEPIASNFLLPGQECGEIEYWTDPIAQQPLPNTKDTRDGCNKCAGISDTGYGYGPGEGILDKTPNGKCMLMMIPVPIPPMIISFTFNYRIKFRCLPNPKAYPNEHRRRLNMEPDTHSAKYCQTWQKGAWVDDASCCASHLGEARCKDSGICDPGGREVR